MPSLGRLDQGNDGEHRAQGVQRHQLSGATDGNAQIRGDGREQARRQRLAQDGDEARRCQRQQAGPWETVGVTHGRPPGPHGG